MLQHGISSSYYLLLDPETKRNEANETSIIIISLWMGRRRCAVPCRAVLCRAIRTATVVADGWSILSVYGTLKKGNRKRNIKRKTTRKGTTIHCNDITSRLFSLWSMFFMKGCSVCFITFFFFAGWREEEEEEEEEEE